MGKRLKMAPIGMARAVVGGSAFAHLTSSKEI
jgi:hypothetical protein